MGLHGRSSRSIRSPADYADDSRWASALNFTSSSANRRSDLAQQRVADVAAIDEHSRKRTAVSVFAVALDCERASIDKLTQPHLCIERQDQLTLASASEALGRVDVDEPDCLARKGRAMAAAGGCAH
jgi:hypothetical protein